MDFRASVGTPVYAAEDGTVNWVQIWDGKTKTGNQSYGNLVRIQHAAYKGKKLETYYAHLSKVFVKNGEKVKEGQLIGYSGATGNCYGAHLHFEVRLEGVRYNPLNWLDADFTKANDAVKLGSYTSVKRDSVKESGLNEIYKIKTSPMSGGDYKQVYNAIKSAVDKVGNIEVYGNGNVIETSEMSKGDYNYIYPIAKEIVEKLGNIQLVVS